MGDGEPQKGLSAAGASKIIKRVAKVRQIAPPARYTVFDQHCQYLDLAFKQVSNLCPQIKANTLKRRLDGGMRDLKKLRQKPTHHGRAKK